jgi:hypothetical protein
MDFYDRDDLPANKWLPCWRNSFLFIQPADSFYAINTVRADAFYHPEFDPADWKKLKNSFLSHIYDSGSGRSIPVSCLYSHLAKRYAYIVPLVTQQLTKRTIYFKSLILVFLCL